MPIFWFLAGQLTTLAALVALLPWLRSTERLAFLIARPRAAALGAVAVVALTLALYRGFGPFADSPVAGTNSVAVAGFAQADKALGGMGGDQAPGSAGASKTPASSMDAAIAKLEARLAQDGGTDGDWELLAKSFEFTGRPEDAAQARAHRLPAQPAEASTKQAAVSGEIALAPGLLSRVAPGETLFIVARSLDSPGMPVAVLKTHVGSWPLKFTLDDSSSMLPDRNLSNAGAVTIVAHISPKDQPLPVSGDLQGMSGAIDPNEHRPLKILIDQVIP
jgi:hypothetical protein